MFFTKRNHRAADSLDFCAVGQLIIASSQGVRTGLMVVISSRDRRVMSYVFPNSAFTLKLVFGSVEKIVMNTITVLLFSCPNLDEKTLRTRPA